MVMTKKCDEVFLVLPAAGRASRLRTGIPKPLLPLFGRPLIDHVVCNLSARAPISRIRVVTNSGNELSIRESCSIWADRAEVIIDDSFLGSAHATLLALSEVNAKYTIVAWPDHVGLIAQKAALRLPVKPIDYVMPVVEVDLPYAQVFPENGRLAGVNIQREPGNRSSRGLSDCGVFLWRTERLTEMLRKVGQWSPDTNILSLMASSIAEDFRGEFPLEADPRSCLGVNSLDELEDAARSFRPSESKVEAQWL